MTRSRPDHHRWQRSLWLSLLFSENTYGFFLLHLPHHQRHPPHRSCSGRRFRRTSMIHSYSSSPTDGNSPDFYKVLNVPRTATPAQIKQAYRNMAKRYHPDANPDHDSTFAFQQVNRAYEVLSDPQLRNRYDHYGPSSLGTSAASDARAAAAGAKSQSGSSSTSTSTTIPVDDPFGPNNPNFHANPWSQRTTPFQYDNFVPDAQWMDGSGVTDGAFGPAGNSFTSHNDILRDRSFYRGGVGGGAFFNDNHRGYNVGDDLQMDLDIDLETASLGGTETIVISHLETCEVCHGRGRTISSCPSCQGLGFIMDLKQTSYGSLQSQRPCPTCRASTDDVVCRICGGYGSVSKSKQVTVQVPPGVESFTRLRIRGQGHAGIKGGRPGDLYLFLHVVPHPVFTRDGTSIRSNVTINYIDAILGATVETPVIGGALATFQVPPGTQEGDDIVLEGYGGRSLIGETNGARGAHVVTAHIAIPEELLEEEKATLLLLQELQAKRSESPNLFEPRAVPLPTTAVETNAYSVGSNSFFGEVSTVEGGTIRVDKFEKKYVNSDRADDSRGIKHDLEEDVHRIEDVPAIFERSIQDPTSQGNFQYSEDEAEKPYFVSSSNNEFDPLRDLLNAPVHTSARSNEDSTRRQKDIQEAEELVERELEKLKDLLYAPIASTAKATKLKADKLKRIKEAEDLVANEMSKLQELLNAPLESTVNVNQVKVKKESRMKEDNNVVKEDFDELRDSLHSPIASTGRVSKAKNTDSEGSTRQNKVERADEIDMAQFGQRDAVEANGGASSMFVTQEDSSEEPFFSTNTRQASSSSSSPSSAATLEATVRSSFSSAGEMNGGDTSGGLRGFGASSQPYRSVSSSSGLGGGVSISAEGSRITNGNGFKSNSDDKDKPTGPQVASQALSASVVAGKRIKMDSTRTTIEAHRQQPSLQVPATLITDVTGRLILDDNGSPDQRKPSTATRTKHKGGSPSDTLDEIGPTIERRRGNSDDADTRFDKPIKRNGFEDGLFSIFKL